MPPGGCRDRVTWRSTTSAAGRRPRRRRCSPRCDPAGSGPATSAGPATPPPPSPRVTGLPVRTDARLRERHFGDWQGLHLTEIAERHPEAHARWRTGDPDPGCGVESLDVLGKRIGSALQEIAEAAAGETIVVATHGGAARQACGYLLGWDPSVLSTIGPMHNCHWAELHHEADRGWRLQAYNAGRLVSGAPAEAV